MFGLDVLVWHGQGIQPPSFLKTIKNYLFGEPLGHSALKLTIPSTPENDALVMKYCQRNGENLIPHYRTEVMIPRKTADPKTKAIHYYPEKQPGWTIYFSYWPDGMNYEHQDRCAGALQIEDLYEIVHPHPTAQSYQNHLQRVKHHYDECSAAFYQAYAQLQQIALQFWLTEIKLRSEKRGFIFWQDKSKVLQLQNKLGKLKNKLKQAETHTSHIEERMNAAKHHFRVAEAHYYSEVATIGANPNASIHIPMDVMGHPILAIENILATMNSLIKYDFHIVLNNCSSNIQDVLSVALNPNFFQTAESQRWLRQSDFRLIFTSTPKTIRELAQKIVHSVMQFSVLQIKESLSKKQSPTTLTSPTRPYLPRAAKKNTINNIQVQNQPSLYSEGTSLSRLIPRSNL